MSRFNVYKYVDHTASAAMLVVNRSASVTPVVNLRNSLHAGEEAHKQRLHHGFETQGRHHQKSKTGISDLTEKNKLSLKESLSSFL